MVRLSLLMFVSGLAIRVAGSHDRIALGLLLAGMLMLLIGLFRRHGRPPHGSWYVGDPGSGGDGGGDGGGS